MAVQLAHEALAEAHDLRVGLALGVEVAAALAAAHGQGGQAVLEDLLKAQELQNGGVHAGVEAQSALVGADGAVILHTEAPVDLDLAAVIHPGHTELDQALRLHKTLHNAVGLVLRVLLHDGFQALQNLRDSLQKFRLVGVAGFDGVQHTVQISVLHNLPPK